MYAHLPLKTDPTPDQASVLSLDTGPEIVGPGIRNQPAYRQSPP